jgi:predicted nucleic acid-binding protein
VAGQRRFTAFLDACALYPILIADALIHLSTAGMFAAKWSREIEREWMDNLARDKPELAGKLVLRRDAMRAATPDWEVREISWRPIVQSIRLPDPGDAHVLAAAVAGHADCIVTQNLKDFPDHALLPFDIEVIHPDDFFSLQLDLDAVNALSAFKRMRSGKTNPTYSTDEFIARFEKNQLPQTAAKLREAIDLI